MNWIEKLDEVKQKLGYPSDAALARALGVTRQYLSDVRRGGKPPSPLLKFRILDKLAYAWTEGTALDLLSDDVREAVKAKLREFQGIHELDGEHVPPANEVKRARGVKKPR
jgi:transcriptional regulator with XRE-family HTH domain